MSGFWVVAFVTLWALVLLLAFLVLGTLRRLTPIIERAETNLAAAVIGASPGGLEPGTVVPPFSVQQVDGRAFTEADLNGSRSIVLFLSRNCQSCERFIRDLKKERVPELGARLVAVTDEPEQARELAVSAEVSVVVQENRSLARIFETNATPHAFVLDEARRVLTSGTPNDWGGLRQLLARSEGGGGSTSNVAAAAVASQPERSRSHARST